jgi:hypothetical protein
MKYDIILHAIWIAGMRMIQQGTDDLSRGGGAGLAKQGLSMTSEVPLSLGALERNALLEPSIRSWAGEEGLVTLTPDGWFSDAHARGFFLWAPPPASDAEAVDQLCGAVHKRPCCLYVCVCVCPLTTTNLWNLWNLWAFLLFSHSAGMNLGSYGVPSQWWTWRLTCVKCQRMTTY